MCWRGNTRSISPADASARRYALEHCRSAAMINSAGILVYRRRDAGLEVFLVHPGGPFWAKKDLGAWSIPKGEYSDDEDALAAARREFAEETGMAPKGEPIPLQDIRQPGGKIIKAWALEGDIDASSGRSNML